jgi:hypothetical protein
MCGVPLRCYDESLIFPSFDLFWLLRPFQTAKYSEISLVNEALDICVATSIEFKAF